MHCSMLPVLRKVVNWCCGARPTIASNCLIETPACSDCKTCGETRTRPTSGLAHPLRPSALPHMIHNATFFTTVAYHAVQKWINSFPIPLSFSASITTPPTFTRGVGDIVVPERPPSAYIDCLSRMSAKTTDNEKLLSPAKNLGDDQGSYADR